MSGLVKFLLGLVVLCLVFPFLLDWEKPATPTTKLEVPVLEPVCYQLVCERK